MSEFHAMAPVWEPCGPGCACNDLTMICRGPITLDVAPLPVCAFCAEPGAEDVYQEDGYPDMPCCADEDACQARVAA